MMHANVDLCRLMNTYDFMDLPVPTRIPESVQNSYILIPFPKTPFLVHMASADAHQTYLPCESGVSYSLSPFSPEDRLVPVRNAEPEC